MIRYFYDCEFIEDGRTIDLISIGIVAEDGREYYAVNIEMPIARIGCHDWLCKNVVPSLPLNDGDNLRQKVREWVRKGNHFNGLIAKTTLIFELDTQQSCVKPSFVIANEVRDFLLFGDDKPELWSWYAAYDHVVLCQLWGTMMHLPEGIPMYTCDLKQECDRLGDPELPEQSSGEHNALSDARHNLIRARYLDKLSGAT